MTALVCLTLIALVCMPDFSFGEDTLLDSGRFSSRYLLQLSGNANNERFTGVGAVLTVSPPSSTHSNPYLLIIEGFPRKNSRNTFFLNSDETEMTVLFDEITCDIKRSYTRDSSIHFYFLSPRLLKPGGMASHKEQEREEAAEAAILPVPVPVQAGKLKLRIRSGRVTGHIWLNGYDSVENSYVRYSAQIAGRKVIHVEPGDKLRK